MNERERPTLNSARTYPIEPSRLLPTVRRAVEGLPRWRRANAEGDEVRAVRKTRLFRFEDDVAARVYPDPNGARLELTSASRLGKGDLGQTPRNLEELLRERIEEMARRTIPATSPEPHHRDDPRPPVGRSG